MNVQYPDILGDFFDATHRFEADGIQYMAAFEPAIVPTGRASTLSFAMQSALDTPVEFSIVVGLPKTAKKLEGFRVAEPQVKVTLQPGAVTELRVPVLPVDVPPGTYAVRLQLQGKPEGRAQRIRPAKSKGRMPRTPIRDTVGLQLASTIGVEYNSKAEKRPLLKVEVQQAGDPGPSKLSPSLSTIWKPEDLRIQIQATKEFNDRRLHIIAPLTRPVLFAAMLNESKQRFAGVGIELTLGEGIFLAKMLTRTVEVFLADEALQDGLFIPIFQRLLLSEVPYDNPVWLLMKFGYEHIVKLATALSFGLVEDVRRERSWSLEEQRAVREFIVTQMRNGDTLPIDLLYVPLILGGILVAREVVMDGEDAQQSLAAIRKSRDIRKADLSQGDELVIKILDELLSV